MFLVLKAHVFNKSSCFYEYSPEKIARVLEVSPNTARSLVSRFIQYGWCRKHRGRLGRYKNLVFNSHLRFSDNIRDSLLVNFEIKKSVAEVMDSLYLALLKVKQAQFNKIKQSVQDIKSPTNLKAYKQARELLSRKNYRVLPDQNAKLQISIKKIAEMFGCSIGKASLIITRLRNSGQIVVESCRQIVATLRDKRMAAAYVDSNPNCYYTGLHVIRVSCNYYKF